MLSHFKTNQDYATYAIGYTEISKGFIICKSIIFNFIGQKG